MATVSGTRAATGVPVRGHKGGVLQVAHGSYTHASNLAAATIIEYCRIPKGAVVVGGFWGSGSALDSADELVIDVGFDGGAELGIFDGTAGDGTISHLSFEDKVEEAGGAFAARSAETVITATIDTDAETGGTGTSAVTVYYYVP